MNDQTVFDLGSGGVRIGFTVGHDREVRLARLVIDGNDLGESDQPIVELATIATGAGSPGRYAGGVIGSRLTYAGHSYSSTLRGAALSIDLEDPQTGLLARVDYELIAEAATLTVSVHLENRGGSAQRIVQISSLALGSASWDAATTTLHLADNDWLSENRWRRGTFLEHGEPAIRAEVHAAHTPRGRVAQTALGTWSTGEHLPMGALETPEGLVALWQIESSSLWHWQVVETLEGLAVLTGGPNGREHQWSVTLDPGSSYRTPTTAVAFASGGIDEAFGALTRYRRRTRRDPAAGERIPIVFNDYMNTLMADPTTAKLLPLIKAVGRTGVDVFCVDAGWYADDPGWWDSVGAWAPSSTRFPEGLSEIFDAIRAEGMTPGLWLEPEAIGVNSPIADELPAESFHLRDGQRVVMDGRYHLDFRHPSVRTRLDGIVDGLIRDFGIGFFKFDYNISPYVGTDVDAPSAAEGLSRSASAFLEWIDALHDRHPGLVVESCASGAMRSDWATMSRFALMSTSDQQDALTYAPIAASAATAVPPEQAGVWCYPQPGISDDAWTVAFAGGMLTRPYLSGHYDGMSDLELGRVSAFVAVHRAIRPELLTAEPIWPLGLPAWDAPWLAFGLRTTSGDVLLTVWRRAGSATVDIPLVGLADSVSPVSPLIPLGAKWSIVGNLLRLALPRESAVTLRVSAR